MAKERVWSYRNVGTADSPVWEKYFVKSVADAIYMTDGDNETVTVASKISTLETAIGRISISDVVQSATNGNVTVKPVSGADREVTVYTHPTVDVSDTTDSTVLNNDETGGTVTLVGAVTTNAAGHVTAITKKQVKIPAAYVHPTIDSPTTQTQADGDATVLTYGGIFAVTTYTYDEAGHRTGSVVSKYKLPAVPTDITGNAGTATALETARDFSISGGATASAVQFDGTGNVELVVTSLDGTKVTGMLPLASIPQAALERLVKVTDDNARFALTENDVQLGDTVQVLYKDGTLTGSALTKASNKDGRMYVVTDVSKLNSEDGYTPYTAGAAATVPWSGVTDAPTDSEEVNGVWTGGLITAAQATKLAGLSNYTHPSFAAPTESSDTAETLTFGGTATFMTGVTTDNGHLTAFSKKTVTLPTISATDLPTVTVDTTDATAESVAHSGTFKVIKSVTTDAYGRVTAVHAVDVTLPAGNNITVTQASAAQDDNVGSDGTFSVVASVTQSGDTVTVTTKDVVLPTFTFANDIQSAPASAPVGSICFVVD